ncbi:MAG: nucleotide-binding protein [Salinibacterium sp.]|nr:nucleotide-binding protein [Salinibacterium sp.]
MNLLDREATHSVIESLYMRFDVAHLPAQFNPNKLKKATHLVEELDKRASGETTLMSLVNYVGSRAFARAEFQRGNPASEDLYFNLDRDLEKASPPPAPPAKPPTFERPGTSGSQPAETLSSALSSRYVFVVRGRDQVAYDALAQLLSALDLRIVTWEDAARGAGGGTPHTLDIVRAGVDMANAVIVLMTPDDVGQVKPDFMNVRDSTAELSLSGQARQNVVFEAGWAMALSQRTVVLVRVGDVRPISDIDGLNYVWLTGDLSSRRSLIGRLKACDLAVDDSGDLWRTAGNFPAQL